MITKVLAVGAACFAILCWVCLVVIVVSLSADLIHSAMVRP